MAGGTFISYRREDSAGFAGRLADSIERRLPTAQVFRDVDGISPGQDFVEAITARLRECRVCLVVIGPHWLDARDASGRRRLDQPDDFVRLEVATALSRPDVVAVPVLVDSATMPPADVLPDVLRPLARRHAVTIRDDSWDRDVERVVELIHTQAGVGQAPVGGVAHGTEHVRTEVPRLAARGMSPVLPVLAVVGLLLAGLAWRWVSSGPATPETSGDAVNASGPGTSSGEASTGTPGSVGTTDAAPDSAAPDSAAPAGAAPNPSALGAGRAVAIPRVSQVGSAGLIYTLMSARVDATAATRRLVLHVALENEGTYPANFWDRSFRLRAGSDAFAPTSQLNVVVQGRATGEGDVTFDVSPALSDVVLRITAAESEGEIPLRLPADGAAPDKPPTPTTRAQRAIVSDILTTPRALFTTPALAATLTRVSTRRFANTLRVSATVRFSSEDGFTLFGNSLVARLAIGDDVLAPSFFPEARLEKGTTKTGTIEFDAPVDATAATLRFSVRDTPTTADVPVVLK